MTKALDADFYLTSDLSLAATLSLFFPLVEIDKSNARKAVFSFQRSIELENLVESYFQNAIKVVPRAYYNQLRDIKARLYSNEHLWSVRNYCSN